MSNHSEVFKIIAGLTVYLSEFWLLAAIAYELYMLRFHITRRWFLSVFIMGWLIAWHIHVFIVVVQASNLLWLSHP